MDSPMQHPTGGMSWPESLGWRARFRLTWLPDSEPDISIETRDDLSSSDLRAVLIVWRDFVDRYLADDSQRRLTTVQLDPVRRVPDLEWEVTGLQLTYEDDDMALNPSIAFFRAISEDGLRSSGDLLRHALRDLTSRCE